MSNLLSGKVESVKFSEHVQQNRTKIEEMESIIASLKDEIFPGNFVPGKSSANVKPRINRIIYASINSTKEIEGNRANC